MENLSRLLIPTPLRVVDHLAKRILGGTGRCLQDECRALHPLHSEVWQLMYCLTD